eukprot:TRINITY_DN5718_c0_g1_i5.p1 TRINITY_DN5718_c0_g1~~TRINITY_DN5718_c0_g1_i5.p1  ORF type:complete len:205 (+),score=45.97 TRINITY_DN5718_c0_g1_i5:1097-1711(+)
MNLRAQPAFETPNTHNVDWISLVVRFLHQTVQQHQNPCISANVAYTASMNSWVSLSPRFTGLASFLRHMQARDALCVPAMVMALIYINRLVQRRALLTIATSERLFVTAYSLANKWHLDKPLPTRQIARAANVHAHQLSLWEKDLCKWIEFHLFINPTTYARASQQLVGHSLARTADQQMTCSVALQGKDQKDQTLAIISSLTS